MVAILDTFLTLNHNVVERGVTKKAPKTKTRDLAFRTFRSNDADPIVRKLTNYSNSKQNKR